MLFELSQKIYNDQYIYSIMKRIFLIVLLACLVVPEIDSQSTKKFKPLSYEEADQKADSLLMLMTLDEKINYIGGDNIFFTRKIRRLGIPSIPFVDATQGVRLNPAILHPGMKKPAKKTIAYPSPILLAATWNKESAYRYAYSIGEECRAAGLPVLLGPGFNLYRNSQCGRNFEYFGEDPLLAGKMIENFVIGLQETGTIATLKHFVANQTDYYRRRSNSILDERTLHEIYMPAFKYGIDAGAMAVMTSYNLVNGEWAGQSEYVINHLLREELGFKWLVMTDWFSVWNGEKLIHSGQDLEMPFRKATKHTKKMLKDKIVSEGDLNRMVKSVLRAFIAMDAFNMEKAPLGEVDYNRLEDVALNTAREGMVLLRNDNQLLPIDKAKAQKILATGSYLEKWVSGKGAAYVKGYDQMLLKDALKSEFGDQITFIKNPTESELSSADIVLLSVGTQDSEGCDRPFDLPEKEEEKVRFCSSHNPNTVVIVTSGSGINMSSWEDAGSILYTWYMGQNGAKAVAEILSGKTNPSGKLPMSIESKFEDSPAFAYIPKGEELYEGFKMRAELKREVYDVHYNEGIFMGYRWYDTKKIDPEFCFGHGLSFTSFEYSDLNINAEQFSASDSIEVKVRIRNDGSLDGKETLQLYVGDSECSVPRPIKELKAFEKVKLKAGESKEVSFLLEPSAFQFWHPENKKWTSEPGEFEILIGASSRDLRLSERIWLK
jgi:beta-glucosidase